MKMPRVITVDKNAAYLAAIDALKEEIITEETELRKLVLWKFHVVQFL